MYLKAWQRRASVREARGDLAGALADLDAGLALAPSSAVLGSAVRFALRRLAAQRGLELPNASAVVPIVFDDRATAATSELAWHDADARKDEQPGVRDEAAHGALPEVQPNPAVSGQAESLDRRVDDTSRVDCHRTSDPASGAAGAPGKFFAARAPRNRAQPIGHPADGSQLSAPLGALPLLDLRTPESASQFETTWRSLAKHPASKVAYVQLLPPRKLSELFKSLLSPALLHGVVLASLSGLHVPDAAKRMQLVDLLDAMPSLNRFSVTVMLLSRGQKRELCEAWDAAEGATPGLAGELSSRLGTLRSRFGL